MEKETLNNEALHGEAEPKAEPETRGHSVLSKGFSYFAPHK